jgi:hypothetical protein
MSEWEEETLKLKKHHGWKGKPGYRIFVADRGAMRFNFPQDWIVVPGDDSINFHDKQPPDDDCRLAVSIMRLPPIDWSALRLSELVQQVLDSEERDVEQKGKIVEEQRGDLELAWAEVQFVDPKERREAFSRICLGRQSNIQCLITFDFWADDAELLRPVWDEVLRSLDLARYVSDPTVGDVVH